MNKNGELFKIEGDNRLNEHIEKCHSSGETLQVFPRFVQRWNLCSLSIQWYCKKCKQWI